MFLHTEYNKASCNFMEREYTFSLRVDKDYGERKKAHMAAGPLCLCCCSSALASAPRMLNNARVILFGRGPLLLDASLSTHPEKTGWLICIESRSAAPLLAAASSPLNPPRPNVSRREADRHLLQPSERLSGVEARRKNASIMRGWDLISKSRSTAT